MLGRGPKCPSHLFPPMAVEYKLGARLRGPTATQRSKGSEKVQGEGVLRRVLRRGPAMGFTVQKGSEKGSQSGF